MIYEELYDFQVMEAVRSGKDVWILDKAVCLLDNRKPFAFLANVTALDTILNIIDDRSGRYYIFTAYDEESEEAIEE